MKRSDSQNDLNRRDFNRLTAAAFGGMLTGSLAGCSKPAEPDAVPVDPAAAGGEGEAKTDVAFLLEEPHVCRGLNTCQGKGASGDNACAGQGTCANANAHTCHYDNECKGQGGCGETAGINSCKGKGECAVPLGNTVWEKTRKLFETTMTENKKEFGDAPEKKSEEEPEKPADAPTETPTE